MAALSDKQAGKFGPLSRREQGGDAVKDINHYGDEVLKVYPVVNGGKKMLTAASMEAVKTLLSLQSQQTPAAVRLGSARAILEIGIKVREVAELKQRLGELERRVDGERPRPYVA